MTSLNPVWKGKRQERVIFLLLSNTVGDVVLIGGQVFYGDNHKPPRRQNMRCLRGGLTVGF